MEKLPVGESRILLRDIKRLKSFSLELESRTKGFVIGYSAGLHLVFNSSLLAATFINEPRGRKKLNEAYPRSNIPEGTFDMLFASVTSIDHMEAVKVARVLFSREIENRESVLYSIYSSQPEYREMIDETGVLYSAALRLSTGRSIPGETAASGW